MSTETTIEQRLAAIEQRLTAIETTMRQVQSFIPPRTPDPNWLDRVVGSMKDESAFLEAMEYGRAYRQSDRPPEDEEP